MGMVEREGRRALKAQRRGRPPVSRLAPHQAATTVRHILSGCPDQLSLPFALWTREAVQELLSRKFDVQVSVWTVGRYLRAWGLTPQKPVRRAYEQNPTAVRKWLEEEYPSIRAQARQFKAQIHWLDEMGLRSDHQAGRSYGRRGQTPVVFGTGQRFRCNMISSITNRGRLAFMIFRQRFTARVFLNFLGRLLRLTRKTRKKVFLVVDGHPVHKARSVTRWLDEHREQIRIFFLPSYSPELNPDELLNQDVKTNALGRVRPINVQEMMDNVRSYLRDHTSKAHGGKELLLRTPRPIRRQLKSVTNLVLGVISGRSITPARFHDNRSLDEKSCGWRTLLFFASLCTLR